jgi:hypothetical protein
MLNQRRLRVTGRKIIVLITIYHRKNVWKLVVLILTLFDSFTFLCHNFFRALMSFVKMYINGLRS